MNRGLQSPTLRERMAVKFPDAFSPPRNEINDQTVNMAVGMLRKSVGRFWSKNRRSPSSGETLRLLDQVVQVVWGAPSDGLPHDEWIHVRSLVILKYHPPQLSLGFSNLLAADRISIGSTPEAKPIVYRKQKRWPFATERRIVDEMEKYASEQYGELLKQDGFGEKRAWRAAMCRALHRYDSRIRKPEWSDVRHELAHRLNARARAAKAAKQKLQV